jgi:ATP-dependent DNA helicase RecQ
MSFLSSNRTLPLQHSSIASNSFKSGSTPLDVLRSVFGHDNFRPNQLEAIEHVLSGKDVIVVMPTGGGKTIIYAVPSLILPGMAIVICPLMMLMCDQVTRLRQHGINACYYNTLLSDNERQNIIHFLMQPGCQYQFVFISP